MLVVLLVVVCGVVGLILASYGLVTRVFFLSPVLLGVNLLLVREALYNSLTQNWATVAAIVYSSVVWATTVSGLIALVAARTSGIQAAQWQAASFLMVSTLIGAISVAAKWAVLLATGPSLSGRLGKERLRVQSRLKDARVAYYSHGRFAAAASAHEAPDPEADLATASNRPRRPCTIVAAVAVGAAVAHVGARLIKRRPR